MNPNVSAAKLDKIIERVRLMMARADHPNTPPAEAKLARERAEKMMADYRIAEDALSAEEKALAGIRPVKREWNAWRTGSEFSITYNSILASILNHVGAQAVTGYGRDEEGRGWIKVTAYGFESDLRFAEVLWQSFSLAFADRLEPEVRDDLSDAENVYRLRSAGIERIRIARLMGWGGTGSATAKVTRLFKEACTSRGEDAAVLTGRGNDVRAFRKSYAEGFRSEVRDRLWMMRQSSGGAQMVLKSRKEAVDELFWADHPEFRPMPASRGLGDSESTPCPKCEKAKSGYCREHQYRKPRKFRYEEDKTNYAALERGREAARSVDLGGSGGNRLEH